MLFPNLEGAEVRFLPGRLGDYMDWIQCDEKEDYCSNCFESLEVCTCKKSAKVENPEGGDSEKLPGAVVRLFFLLSG